MYCSRIINLVNIHLFHDDDNLVALEEVSPVTSVVPFVCIDKSFLNLASLKFLPHIPIEMHQFIYYTCPGSTGAHPPTMAMFPAKVDQVVPWQAVG